MKTPPVRIAIAIPTTGTVDWQFAICLAEMCAAVTGTLGADGIADLFIADVEGAPVDKARNSCIEQAVKGNATHILWLDTDMLFPKHTCHKLLAANADIVGVNYSTRRPPCQPVTYKKLPDVTTGYLGERCFTKAESKGYEEVEGIGFGIVLTRIGVFADVTKPAFDYRWRPDTRTWIGEDIDFCVKAREKGYTIRIDHDLSKQVGHVGRFVYTNQMLEPTPEIVAPTAEDIRHLKLVH